MTKAYVRAIKSKGCVIGYGVYDKAHGMETEHSRYMIKEDGSYLIPLHLANMDRDDRNAGIV